MPRLSAAILPTPLHGMPHLQAALGPGCPRLLIKRDDMTGLALGGNKARKLEYLFADARQQNCDTLLTCGAAQSNHALQTAAAAAKFGYAAHCILDGPPPGTDNHAQGNLLLHQWLQTPIHWTIPQSGETRSQARNRTMQAIAAFLRESGSRPYLIPTGGSTAVGALGYVQAVEEIQAQLQREDKGDVEAVFFASGSGGTHAGLALGARLTHWQARMVGVNVDLTPPEAGGILPFHREITELANDTAALLQQPALFSLADIELCSDYAGPAYGIPTPEGEEAIRLLARTEGIFTDPVYSGKALSALIGEVRAGRFQSHQTVVFWHTGGTAGLFAPH